MTPRDPMSLIGVGGLPRWTQASEPPTMLRARGRRSGNPETSFFASIRRAHSPPNANLAHLIHRGNYVERRDRRSLVDQVVGLARTSRGQGAWSLSPLAAIDIEDSENPFGIRRPIAIFGCRVPEFRPHL